MELKTCPFCGGKAGIMAGCSKGSTHTMEIIDNGASAIIGNWKFFETKSVWCSSCVIIRGGKGETEREALEEAIRKWNMRAKTGEPIGTCKKRKELKEENGTRK